MIDVVDAGHCCRECLFIVDIALDDRDGEVFQPCRTARLPQQTTDCVAFLKEEFNKMAADEAAATGNECCFHGGSQLTFRRW